MNRNELLDELTRAVHVVLHAERQWPFGDWQGVAAVLAAGTLARHIQRLYDPTPISIEWLERLRRVDGGDFSFMAVRLCDDGLHLMGLGGVPRSGIEGIDDYVAPSVATRGDVRRLCDALGVTLREEP